MPKTDPVIFTIGYSGLPPDQLRLIAEALDADVIDCRYKPTSRNASYRQGPLKKLLGERYLWAGDVLGGYGHTNRDGFAFLRGRRKNSLLLCMCHAPGNCHLHNDVCKVAFPNAIHIYEDELILASDLSRAIADDADYDILGSLDELLAGGTEIQELFS